MKASLGGFDTKQVRPLLALLLLLAAAWQAWSGWQIVAANRLGTQTEGLRRQIADQLRPLLKKPLDQAERLKNRMALSSALQRNDINAAKDVVAQGWEGIEAIEFYHPDLQVAYADPATFGYGKLGVLERALQDGRASLAIAKDAGGPRLVVAVPVQAGDGQLLSVVYVRLPAAPVMIPLKDITPAGAYAAVRQGNHSLAESDDKHELRIKAEAGAIAIDGTPLRVVTTAPLAPEGLGELHGLGEFVVAAVLALLAAGLLLWPRLRSRPAATPAAAPADEAAPTLAELEQAAKPAPAVVRTTTEHPAMPKLSLDRSIFRAYDIRGVVGSSLDGNIARMIGQAIGSVMAERGQRSIVVGRDGRLSSPSLSEALIDGLRKAGREVIDIGQAPTPLVYFGAFHLRTGCGVSVTGSHNPPDYNGFKIVIDGETLSGDAIQELYVRISENRLLRADSPGSLSVRDIKVDYVNRIAGDVQIERKLKVVIDCGSGVAGAFAPELLEAIGAEVEPLFCEVDGHFPHHHPDPSDPANLLDLVRVVQRVGADIGLALDGDGDRLGVVTRAGEMIYPDRLLMLFASDVLERNPGACVIYDVKCTGYLATHILRHGGSPLMWKTGHSLIKAKMKETEAELAGEMSGHFFFRERWYGFDDGLYAAARLLEILAAAPETPEEMFAALPTSVSTPELKIPVAEGQQYAFVEKFVAAARFEGARIATIDGLRADWPDGWGLVRASNTTPVLVLRFDGKDAEALQRVQGLFREQLLAVDPGLQLPF
jgi:phosphomannomutase/phosphoglucomutase